MDVLVFGSAIVDFISYVERLPEPGETVHGTKFAMGFGGKGANQCVAATRLGARTALIAKLGDDAWGKNYLVHLEREGIDIRFVEICKGETTGIAQINVAANGENNIVIVVGANNMLSNEDVLKGKEFFQTAKVLVCQFETPLDATLTALQSFNGISILNAAPALANTSGELLKYSTILCVNETEASLMTGKIEVNSVEQSKVALMALQKMGANTIIITLGVLGAVFVEKSKPNEYIHVPSNKVAKVVDTTGAGDAFIGALAFFLARYPNMPLHQLIGAACEIASFSVQYPGTQASFPNTSQIGEINPNNTKFKTQYSVLK